MGKKTKKTKWRTLEISLPMPGKHYRENGTSTNLPWDDGWHASSNKYRRGGGCDKIIKTSAKLNVCAQNSSSGENQRAETQAEDEYTKITTPRQDVLFKKSYLTKRKALLHAGTGTAVTENAIDDLSTDGVAMTSVGVTGQNCIGGYGEEFCDYADVMTDGGSSGGDISSLSRPHSHLVCATSQPYMDASSAAAATAIYYGGGYEIYDPYTGNLTAVVVGAASPATGATAAATATTACQPILTSIPCRPVPLQSIQWFNPVLSTSEWCSSDSGVALTQQDDVTVSSIDAGASKVSCSTGDSMNVNESASVSSPTIESTSRTTGAGADDAFYTSQSAYVYPSYVLGTPVYSLADDDGNLRYCSPGSPMLSGNESTTTKRKKKRKRRRRFGDAEGDSESEVEEYRQDSLSGNELVFAYAYDQNDHDRNSGHVAVADSDVDVIANVVSQSAHKGQHDNDSNGDRYRHRHRAGSTLSHASINAPPFVPANRAFVDDATQMPAFSDGSYRYSAPSSIDEYVVCLGGVVESTSSSESNARPTATSTDNRNKSPTDSSTSSGNSDSGIGSPGNEDCASTDGRDFVRTAKATATAVAADRSKSVRHFDSVTPSVLDISEGDGGSSFVASDAADSTTAAYATDTGGTRKSFPIDVDVGDYDDDVIAARGPADTLKKMQMKNTSRSKRHRSKNEERDRELDADSEFALTNKTERGRDDGQGDNDDGKKLGSDADESHRGNQRDDDDDNNNGKPNRKKRSKKSTKIQNRRQTERTTVIDERLTDSPCCGYDSRATILSADPRQEDGSESAPIECKCDTDTKCARDQYDEDDENGSLHPESPSLCASSSLEISNSIVRNKDEDDRRNDCILIDQIAYLEIDVEDSSVDSSLAPSSSPRSILEIESGDGAPVQVQVEAKTQAKIDVGLESVALVARTIVDEIVQEAALRICTSSTEKCDKLRLPLTQAVTNWMKESGGLPVVVGPRPCDHRRRSSTRSVEDSSHSRVTLSKTTKSVETFNCVVC